MRQHLPRAVTSGTAHPVVSSRRWAGGDGGRGGFTLAEVLVASVIAAVIAGGTMMAFVAADKMMRTRTNPALAEAAAYGQQTMERYRNKIRCGPAEIPDLPDWFDTVTCAPTANLPTTWTNDPITTQVGNTGSESISKLGGLKRCYQVVQNKKCGTGDPLVADCYSLEARVCWDNDAVCPCPP